MRSETTGGNSDPDRLLALHALPTPEVYEIIDRITMINFYPQDLMGLEDDFTWKDGCLLVYCWAKTARHHQYRHLQYRMRITTSC
jgi:hypothetical protein